MSVDVLPDSRAKVARNVVMRGSVAWVPFFCANCGVEGGLCPEENMTFAFYLCNPCATNYGAVANMQMVPDEVFWQKFREAQLEQFGRELTDDEVRIVLDDVDHPLAGLAREIFNVK
jgi:hypothetical protein